MARPAKSVALVNKNLSKEERQIRQDAEESYKGNTDNIVPPKWLNTKQKKIFNNLVEEMKYTKILCNLDVDILATYAVSIHRLEEIEKAINKDPQKMLDEDIMKAQARYSQIYFKCQKELCLNPTSRAKIGTIALQEKQKAQDPVMRLLKRSDEK